MKISTLLATACLIAPAFSNAAPVQAAPPHAFPKNLARQHLGTNIFLFNQSSQAFAPTEAAAAWLDDDVATGWPAATNHQYYMITLAQAELITNFAISTRGSAGSVSLYAGDEAAPPGARSWVPLAKNLSVESLNQKSAGQIFSRFAKYVLVETNLTEAGPWYGIYLYGEKQASVFSLEKRAQAMDAQSIFRFVNDQTSISLSSLYAKAQVVYANSEKEPFALQNAIDDNPDTSVVVAASDKSPGMVVRFHETEEIQRISALVNVGAKGRLDFYLVGATPPTLSEAGEQSQYLRASYDGAQPEGEVALPNLKPAGSITLDGVNPRGGVDFAAQKAVTMLVTWTPETPGQTVSVREVNSFGNVGVTNHRVSSPADPIGELSGYDASKDGKEALGGKEALSPVGEQLLAPKTPFVPGLPPSPPIIPLSPGTP